MLAGDGEVAGAIVARYERMQAKLIGKLRAQMRGDFARFVAAENRALLYAALAEL